MGTQLNLLKMNELVLPQHFCLHFKTLQKSIFANKEKINEIWGVDQNVKQMVLMFTICQSKSVYQMKDAWNSFSSRCIRSNVQP